MNGVEIETVLKSVEIEKRNFLFCKFVWSWALLYEQLSNFIYIWWMFYD